MNVLFHRVRLIPKYLPKNHQLRISYSALDWIKSTGVIDALRRANDKKMESAPGNKPKPLERSYLSAAVESISPWGGSRASTPKPTTPTFSGEGSGLKNQHGGDHSTNHWHGWSTKNYPQDCPPLNPRWYHAVDVGTHTQSIGFPSLQVLDSQKKTQDSQGQSRRNQTYSPSQEIRYIFRTRFSRNRSCLSKACRGLR